MDLHEFHFSVTVASCLWIVAYAQKQTDKCIDKTLSDDSARLTCGNGNIYSVNLTSWTSDCKESETNREVCSGKTPSLLVTQLNCYWQHDCVIQLPQDPIIMTENATCFGQYGESIWLSYRCIEPTMYLLEGSQANANGLWSNGSNTMLLVDICSNVINGSSVVEISGQNPSLSGVIRSHKHFPWSYSSEQRNCSLKMIWPENQKLVYTVRDIHLDEGDTFIVGNKKPVNVASGTYQLKNEYMTFMNFTVGNESRGADGFVFCFRFIAAKRKADKDVCESITQPETVASNKSKEETVESEDTTEEIPERCKKKKSKKAQTKCADRMKNKKDRGRKKKKRDRKKKPKDPKKKRRRKSKKQKN